MTLSRTAAAPIPPARITPPRTATAVPPDATHLALVEAAATQGFDATDAVLLWEGRNCVYRLPRDRAIGKVHGTATSYADADRQLRAAEALIEAGFPTAAPAGRVAHPIRAGNRLITFTRDLGRVTGATPRHLGQLMARLHRLPPLTGIGLPTMDLAGRAERRITALPPTAVTDNEREHLREFLGQAAADYERTDWPQPRTVYGDATPANTVVTPREALLVDLESLTIGNPCVDQATPAWSVGAFNLNPVYNQAFVAGYGYDIASVASHRYRALVPFFGLSSALFYLELSASRPDVRPEARRRLHTILERRPMPWGWTVGPVIAPTCATT
nr:hypothetical protein KPHV_86310 [Kitasatospora purpeofusca]